MIFKELEQELDDFLSKPNAPDEAVDEHWRIAAAQLEKELTLEANAADKKSMIRIIAKSVVAYDKQTDAKEQFLKTAVSLIENLDNSMKNSINTFRDDMKKSTDEIMKLEIANLAKTLSMQAQKELSRAGGLALHAKTTHVKRDKIISYWRKNISADNSNEFAAELLQKEFPEVSHRTLAKYVSDAKKRPITDALGGNQTTCT